jgi:hypothetical protein
MIDRARTQRPSGQGIAGARVQRHGAGETDPLPAASSMNGPQVNPPVRTPLPLDLRPRSG